jgi:hypothetical protein
MDWSTGLKPLLILLAMFPWMGIIARLVTPAPQMIALIGALLWLVAFFAFRYLLRTRAVSKGGRDFGAGMLVWTLSFVALYLATALMTGAALSRYHTGR